MTLARGYPFPDVEKLRRGLALRNWTRGDLADRAGLAPSVVYAAVAGRPVSPGSIAAIAQALIDNPPATPTGVYVGGSTD